METKVDMSVDFKKSTETQTKKEAGTRKLSTLDDLKKRFPVLTPDAIERDKREIDIVEINLRDQSAQIVKASDAPLLTAEVIREKLQPIQPVYIVFDVAEWVVMVRQGRPLDVQLAQERLLKKCQEEKATPEEQAITIKHLLLSKMIIEPAFAYADGDAGHPIQACSDILINTLWDAYLSKNAVLIEDSGSEDVYQITVRRGSMPDADLEAFNKTFDTNPVRAETIDTIGTSIREMSDKDIARMAEGHTIRRDIVLSSMILSPAVCRSEKSAETDAFPLTEVSEWGLQTLFEATVCRKRQETDLATPLAE